MEFKIKILAMSFIFICWVIPESTWNFYTSGWKLLKTFEIRPVFTHTYNFWEPFNTCDNFIKVDENVWKILELGLFSPKPTIFENHGIHVKILYQWMKMYKNFEIRPVFTQTCNFWKPRITCDNLIPVDGKFWKKN